MVVSTVDDRSKAQALGAAEFCLKPLGREDLLNLLDRITEGTSRQRILVIDDDDIFRYVVRQELSANNVRVLEAATGLAGIERAARETFDVVLLDLDLPDITGYEVLKQLKHGERQRCDHQRDAAHADGTDPSWRRAFNCSKKRANGGSTQNHHARLRQKTGGANLMPASILVVDDQSSGRYIKSRALRKAGYRVSETGTAADALAYLAQHAVDLPSST